MSTLLLLTCFLVLDSDLDDEPRCDDGSSAYTEEGPNWQCTRDGCSPRAATCHPERLAHCYDAAGTPSGRCVIAREECQSRLGCFDVWFWCAAGQWECKATDALGLCTDGVCGTDIAPYVPGTTLQSVNACLAEVL